MSDCRPQSLVAFEERLVTAATFRARYTGAEANVAASLAGFGIPADLVGAVPDTALREACLAYLRRYGVGTQGVLRRAGRLGILFTAPGGAGRPPMVVLYDRVGSAFVACDPDAYDWTALFAGHTWLHVSVKAPALSPQTRTAITDALLAARRLELGTSLDLNYRAALCSHDEAGRVLAPLVEQVDVLLGSGRVPPPACARPERADRHGDL